MAAAAAAAALLASQLAPQAPVNCYHCLAVRFRHSSRAPSRPRVCENWEIRLNFRASPKLKIIYIHLAGPAWGPIGALAGQPGG